MEQFARTATPRIPARARGTDPDELVFCKRGGGLSFWQGWPVATRPVELTRSDSLALSHIRTERRRGREREPVLRTRGGVRAR